MATKWNERDVRWEPDHTLMTDEQLARCTRAYDLDDAVRWSIPTRNVSNGEYVPKPQTREQALVDQRIHELTEANAAKLGLTPGEFHSGDEGIAAGLVAMNDVHGEYFDISTSAIADEAEFREGGVPKDVFIVDDQLHFVRGKFSHDLARAAAQGPSAAASGFPANPYNPEGRPDEHGAPWAVWNPELVGLPIEPDAFHLVQFVKDVFLDSQTTVGLISNVTSYVEFQPGTNPNPVTSVEHARDSEILTAAQTAAARDFINQTAGSRRALCHGLLYTGPGNLDYIQYQIEHHHPDSWKGYTIANAAKIDTDPRSLMRRWRQDDEAVAYPTYQAIADAYPKMKKRYPGFNTICVHKGLVPGDTRDEPEYGHPGDLPKACRDWPQLNFVTYHSCIKDLLFYGDALDTIRAAEAGHSEALLGGVPNIPWTTLYAQITAEFANSYAELGTTFASTVITFPTVTAHLLGQLLKYKGEDNIVWGTDSVWYGSPQWQLEAFWRFRIPDSIRERWGYPELTEQAKRKILGLNSARIYGLNDRPDKYKPVPEDFTSKIRPELADLLEIPVPPADRFADARRTYRAAGARRSTLRYGWVQP